ncbi:MAG: beta-ketoacyl-ACP synthase II [Clostridiales bacterium]|nr:beta-ketoacyl-ACP synthase II [Clostridiales bacterium]
MRKVVITGMGLVSPVGNNVTDFWTSLINGKCGIGPITRYDTSDFKVKIAAEVKDFDPSGIMDKSEIRRSDLFTRYAMVAAHQAMQDSGLEQMDKDRLGVYIGSGIGGISTMVDECIKLQTQGPHRVSPFMVPMMIANIAAGQVAIRYGARGPCLPVVTACATSSHAIGEAFRAIAHGYADVIISGGAEASIVALSVAGFTSSMALSLRNDPQSSSIPFDKRRDGFVMGEGAGVLILEAYEHAKARNAKIYAEVSGYGNTCDAYHITSPLPDASSASKAIQNALNESGIKPDEHLYINAHGTSTPLNDKTETLAIKKALGEAAQHTVISSTKSMTGHMLGAAGAVEAIACVLALKNGIVPPTIGYKEPDPDCDLDYTPNHARQLPLTSALSISLGFGGHNACLAFCKTGID